MSKHLNFHDSRVQERMMRIGIEVRALRSDVELNNDELAGIAIKTLKDDGQFIRENKTQNIYSLFAAQILQNSKMFLFFAMNEFNSLEIFKCADLQELATKYSCGEMCSGGYFPRLYCK